MPKKKVIDYVKLGLFVTAGLVILVVSLYFVGSKKNLFGDTFKLYVEFRDINGLKKGNNVRYGGIDIGSVDDIIIVNDTTIKIEMVLESQMKSLIKKDSEAGIGTDGLMGDKLINIHAGSPGAETIAEGDVIRAQESIDTDEMLRTLQFTNNNVAIVSANLKSLTETINKSKGTLYTVLMDTTLSEQIHRALQNIENASRQLSDLGSDLSAAGNDLQDGKGLLGTLLKDSSVASDFKSTMASIKTSGEQLNAATQNMQVMMETAAHGNGSLNMLLSDTSIANNFRNAIQNIDSSSVKLNENLEALQHSWLLRGYFKKQEKKN